MWNRRESQTPSTDSQKASREVRTAPSREFMSAPAQGAPRSEGIVNIGQSICIRGELTGNEDLTIDGKLEGKIDLKEHHLTIGPNGQIQAELGAKTVLVKGEVTGNIVATDKVELAETGRVKGDIVAPRIAIADGARFKGSVDMSGAQPAHSASSTKAVGKEKQSGAAQIITDGAPSDSRAAARP